MLGKFRSIFIVLVFEFTGNISYLSKYILWLKVVLLLVLYRISCKSNGNLSFRFSFSVIYQAVQMISKTLSCLLLRENN